MDTAKDTKNSPGGGFSVLHHRTAYAIPFHEWHTFFDRGEANNVKEKTKSSFGIHYWNRDFTRRARWRMNVGASGLGVRASFSTLMGDRKKCLFPICPHIGTSTELARRAFCLTRSNLCTRFLRPTVRLLRSTCCEASLDLLIRSWNVSVCAAILQKMCWTLNLL